jgi:MFS family permease
MQTNPTPSTAREPGRAQLAASLDGFALSRSPVRASLRHNLRCSVIDGTAYMVMVGLAESFFPIFVLLMFRDAAASGLVLTLPVFLANLLQLGAPKLVRAVRSYRKAVVLCASVQCFACFPLAAIALYGAASETVPGKGVLVLTFLIASAYYAGAIVGGSPWSAMISALVPQHVRTRFMGQRNRTLQLGAVVGVMAGAFVLDAAPKLSSWLGFSESGLMLERAFAKQPQLAMFALLFVMAGIARAVSTYYLHAHSEPSSALAASPQQATSTSERIGFARGAHGALALGIIAFNAAMMFGSPFFHAYAKDVGDASMLEYAGLIVVWLLGKALALNWAGDYAQRHGKHRLMQMSLLLMLPVPLLWAASSNLVWLAVAQLIAGIAIGAYELSVWFLTVDAYSHPSLSPSQRTRLIARFTLATAIAGACTSALGGQLLHTLQLSGVKVYWQDAAWLPFAAVFAVSTLLRAVAAWWLSRRTRAGWLRSSPGT